MKNRNLLFLLIFIIVLFSILILKSFNQLKIGENKNLSGIGDAHRIDSFDAKIFYNSISKAGDKKLIGAGKIGTAIVPHYYPAGYLIAQLFQEISDQNIKRVIVIGPNHREKGAFKVTSSNKNWATNFGLLNTDSQFIKKMEKAGLVNFDDSVLESEQSIEVLAL
ncbi:AmmeMemoRadiSam system protein B, partial [Candidatus Gottesmanbacteria bacterium RBG_16_37_8]